MQLDCYAWHILSLPSGFLTEPWQTHLASSPKWEDTWEIVNLYSNFASKQTNMQRKCIYDTVNQDTNSLATWWLPPAPTEWSSYWAMTYMSLYTSNENMTKSMKLSTSLATWWLHQAPHEPTEWFYHSTWPNMPCSTSSKKMENHEKLLTIIATLILYNYTGWF